MTAYDDLTDSSPESPGDELADQPGGQADDETTQGPGVDSSDRERGNLDGSTPSEGAREDALDAAADSGQDNGRNE